MEEKLDKKPEHLVLEKDVEAALHADKGQNAQLKSFAVKPFTQIGDNFASIVMTVVVQYEQGGSSYETSYIVKLNPCRGELASKMLAPIYLKESQFYSQMVPLLNKELETVGEAPLKMPKYFHSVETIGNEACYFQNLKQMDFKMNDRKKGLDRHHTNLLVKELGRLHAASVIHFSKNQLKGNKITDKYPVLEEGMTKLYSDEAGPMTMNSVFDASMQSCARMIEGIEGYDFAVKYLQSKLGTGKESFMEMIKTKAKFEVICHGDCWNNNFLFRYGKNGRVIDCHLLDLQICRLGSPALDLNYMFFTSLNGEVRQEYLHDFLSTYYASFASTLAAAKLPAPFTLGELTEEYYSKNFFGLISGLTIVPTILNDLSDDPAIKQMTESRVNDLSEAEIQKMMKDYQERTIERAKTNPLIKPRLLAMFDDGKESGLIGRGSVISLIKSFNSMKKK